MNDARRRLRAVGNSSTLAPSPTYRVDGSSRATPVAKGGRMSNVRSATRAGRRLGMYSAAVSAALLVASAGVSAAPMTFRAALVPETAEYQTGSGEVIVVYDDVNHMLRIATSFAGLTGTTTVAHIHCCTALPFDGTVGVAVTPGTLPGFPTGMQSGKYWTELNLTSDATYTAGFLAGAGGTPGQAEMALVAGMFDGTAYFNVHSTAVASGEIRGFLQPVPEPVSLLLLGVTGGAAWAARHSTSRRDRRR